MRFTVAWANVISENLALKLSLGCLILVLGALSTVTLKLAARKPLVIERGCLSQKVPTVDGERSSVEVENFVREAVAMRFDAVVQLKPDYLSEDETKFRAQEQQEFKKRDLTQRVVVNGVAINGDQVTVNADRLFSVGAVRSALPFPLALTLGSVARTEWNPYGLTLLQVSALPTSQPTGGAGK